MFNADTHVPQLLEPEQYFSPDQYSRELESMFDPEWHFVCTTADLPRDGDFRTLEFCSRPVIIRNFGGSYQAFLNVCPHRFCRLSGEPTGRSDMLRCQYHGWEFDHNGQTRRIPDAPNFRPMKKGQANLTALRTERCGQLIFVNFSPEGPSLAESYSKIWDKLSSWVSDDWTQIMTLQTGPEGNWKCAMEITLEGYHVYHAHADSLGRFPQPEEADWMHDLSDPQSLDLTANLPPQKLLQQRLERFALSLLRRRVTDLYSHVKFYPGFGCINQDLFSVAQSILPTGPREHINLYRLFMYTGPNTRLQRAAAWFCGLAGKPVIRSLWRKTFLEDQVLIRETQKGLESAQLPPGGLISRREECVVHFQKYIQQRCGSPLSHSTDHASAPAVVPPRNDRPREATHACREHLPFSNRDDHELTRQDQRPGPAGCESRR